MNCIWRKPFNHLSSWEICKGWVLLEDPPQQRVGPTPVFGNASSTADGDEDGSPTIQETRVENPSSSEGSIPRAMGRNKARKLKENGKAKDDYATGNGGLFAINGRAKCHCHKRKEP